MLSDDILFGSITEQAALIRSKKLSPVELTESYLQRLETIGPKLNAVAEVMRASALEEAKQAEAEIKSGKYRGLLHGIPYGAKDLLATKNAKTTWGATPYKNQQFSEDATIIKKLREAGAILVAKLAMIELAGGMGYNTADSCWTGACKTPWNTNFWSGGSSSGPGAASAAALVSFSIGSETSGSIITPAAYCGLSGLRPTYGAVSRHGAMALSWTLDKLGPMCRSAKDCEIVFDAIKGLDALDATSKDFPSNAKREAANKLKRRIRIGVMQGSYTGAQTEVKDNFLKSVDALKTFADVEMDVRLPDTPGQAVGVIVSAEGASAFRDLIESGGLNQLASPLGKVGGYTASLVTAVDYLHAMRLRAPARKAWNEMFKKIDVLVAPSRSTVAYPTDKTFNQAYPGIAASSPIGASNLVGVPAISVPNGFGQNNLPTGIQFIGPAWSEYILLAVAEEYQQATDWHLKRPNI